MALAVSIFQKVLGLTIATEENRDPFLIIPVPLTAHVLAREGPSLQMSVNVITVKQFLLL